MVNKSLKIAKAISLPTNVLSLLSKNYILVDESCDKPDYCLDIKDDRYIFSDSFKNMNMVVDFLTPELDHRLKYSMSKNQIFFKALGQVNKGDLAFDLTAGLGVDTFIMANFGLRVVGVERNPLLHFLLDHAKTQYYQQRGSLGEVEFSFLRGDGSILLEKMILDYGEPKIVYLDPMFPEKKKAALPGKEMQILGAMLPKNTDEELESIIAKLFDLTQGARVVLKRPLNSEQVYRNPLHSFKGKALRYDIYKT